MSAPTRTITIIPAQVETSSWLLDSYVRLVTLTGPGGTGRTRLAIEVAAPGSRGLTAVRAVVASEFLVQRNYDGLDNTLIIARLLQSIRY